MVYNQRNKQNGGTTRANLVSNLKQISVTPCRIYLQNDTNISTLAFIGQMILQKLETGYVL